MEDNNRVYRRSRPRPYDLRRKVLLKNFLREQMTHIPFPETSTQTETTNQNDDINFTEELPVSIHLDDDIAELNENLCESAASENEQNSSSVGDKTESNLVVPIAKSDSFSNTENSANTKSSCESVPESSLLKFTSLVKLKTGSKKTVKGIFKAKDRCKSVRTAMKTRSFKSGLERVFYGRKRPDESASSNQTPKKSPRALFSLFKRRREQRNLKEPPEVQKSPSKNFKTDFSSKYSSTTNQSIQTDDSWAREELYRVQQSNMRLKEENRLLSESLSFFMSNSSMDPQMKHFNSPLQSSNQNINNTVFPDYYVPSSNSACDSWNPRPRVTRSKSMQEYERRNSLRNNYRTRSMSYHNYRPNISNGIQPPMFTHDAQPSPINVPRIRRKNTLNLPVSNTVRGIHRRSSMPERILSENDRSRVCHRSGSFRDTYTRKPFNSLPSEAFY